MDRMTENEAASQITLLTHKVQVLEDKLRRQRHLTERWQNVDTIRTESVSRAKRLLGEARKSMTDNYARSVLDMALQELGD